MAQDCKSKVSLTTLDSSDIRSIDLSCTCKILLSPAHRFAFFADAHAKLFKHVIFHAHMFINYGL